MSTQEEATEERGIKTDKGKVFKRRKTKHVTIGIINRSEVQTLPAKKKISRAAYL